MKTPENLDMTKLLSRWYLPQAIYADEAKRSDGEVIVTYEVKDYHCDPAQKPNLRGEITEEGTVQTNTFLIDGTEPHHTQGHLRGMPIFPGHMADGALIEAANAGNKLWLVGFRNIMHTEPGVPGDKLVATTTLLREESGARVVRGIVNCEDRVHTRILDMRFEEDLSPVEAFCLSQHQLFEIGAQAAGGAVALLQDDLLEDERDPIFVGIGSSVLEKVVLRPKDVLTSKVTVRRISSYGAFYVDVVMARENDHIASFHNLGIGFLPHDQIKAKIDGLQHAF